jgi:hypothetical protein
MRCQVERGTALELDGSGVIIARCVNRDALSVNNHVVLQRTAVCLSAPAASDTIDTAHPREQLHHVQLAIHGRAAIRAQHIRRAE